MHLVFEQKLIIASIANQSETKIISRFHQSYETFCKTISFGKHSEVTRSLFSRQIGTSIIITNLFKYQPLKRSFSNLDTEKRKLFQTFYRIKLPFDKIDFKLTDSASNKIIYKENSMLKENQKIIILEHLSSLKDYYEIKEKDIEIILSKKHYSSKDHQYIYINDRYVINEEISNLVNHFWNRYLLQEKLTKVYPIFFLNLKINPKEYQITIDIHKKMIIFKVCLQIINDRIKNKF